MHFTLRKSTKIAKIKKWGFKRHLTIFRNFLNFQGKNDMKNMPKTFFKFHLVSHYALYHYSWCKAMSAAARTCGDSVSNFWGYQALFATFWCHMLEGCLCYLGSKSFMANQSSFKVSTNVQTNLCLRRATIFFTTNNTCRHEN